MLICVCVYRHTEFPLDRRSASRANAFCAICKSNDDGCPARRWVWKRKRYTALCPAFGRNLTVRRRLASSAGGTSKKKKKRSGRTFSSIIQSKHRCETERCSWRARVSWAGVFRCTKLITLWSWACETSAEENYWMDLCGARWTLTDVNSFVRNTVHQSILQPSLCTYT